ncbi:unnamed protein product, partial [Mesorhabditis spiculigera]
MIRLEPDEDETEVPPEHRFYYLRLMAKPGRTAPEPIRTKFVRWSEPEAGVKGPSGSDDPTLESQAMRVVRTIGQAFEVCHKNAQDQLAERHEDDPTKRSLISEEEVATGLDAIGEEKTEADNSDDDENPLKKIMEDRESESPMEPPIGPLYGKRISMYHSRKTSDASSSAGTAIDMTLLPGPSNQPQPCLSPVEETSDSHPLPNPLQVPQSSVSNPLRPPHNPQPSTSQIPPPPQGYPPMAYPSMYPGGSATLPHSSSMPGQWPPMNQYPSVPQELQNPNPGNVPFYPMSYVPPSSSMPFGLSSPVMVSPYATLQLPQMAVDPNNPDQAAQWSRSLDQYNQQLIRSQLDQAQQTAQVAGCQVQLLRDQLTSETTARLEAQSRTHQLLNANRELLEQVQTLVQRLQHLETKITTEIQQNTAAPASGSSTLPRTSAPPIGQYSSGAFEARVPSGQAVHPAFKNITTEARSGSLPPQKLDQKPRRQPVEDFGELRGAIESTNDDTTDYSSSDYEKVTAQKTGPFMNVLMTNPMAAYPQHLVMTQAGTQSALRSLMDRVVDDGQMPGPSSTPPKKKAATGVFGNKEFSRMSFNAKLRERRENPDETLEEEEDKERSPERKERDRPIERKKDKVTVDSLFKNSPEESPNRELTRRDTTASGTGLPSHKIEQILASDNLVTAMYPPIRKPVTAINVARPKFEVVKKKQLRALSMDMPEGEALELSNRLEPKISGPDQGNSYLGNRSSPPTRKKNLEFNYTPEDRFNRNILAAPSSESQKPYPSMPNRNLNAKMPNGQPPHF